MNANIELAFDKTLNAILDEADADEAKIISDIKDLEQKISEARTEESADVPVILEFTPATEEAPLTEVDIVIEEVIVPDETTQGVSGVQVTTEAEEAAAPEGSSDDAGDHEHAAATEQSHPSMEIDLGSVQEV